MLRKLPRGKLSHQTGSRQEGQPGGNSEYELSSGHQQDSTLAGELLAARRDWDSQLTWGGGVRGSFAGARGPGEKVEVQAGQLGDLILLMGLRLLAGKGWRSLGLPFYSCIHSSLYSENVSGAPHSVLFWAVLLICPGYRQRECRAPANTGHRCSIRPSFSEASCHQCGNYLLVRRKNNFL